MRAMKKRLLFALGLCAVAIFVFLQTRPKPIEPPTQRPTEAELKQLFPADSRAVFEGADRMILYSIETLPDGGVNTFHDYPIVGQTEIADVKTRRALVAHIYHGIATHRDAAGCFDPRHAIRASKGDKTVDLVICFSCSGIEVHYGKEIGRGNTSETPQNFYDSVLEKAGVPLKP